MAMELQPLPHASSAHVPSIIRVDVLAAFLAGRKATTLRAYSADLEDFAGFTGSNAAAVSIEDRPSGDVELLAVADDRCTEDSEDTSAALIELQGAAAPSADSRPTP